MASKILKGIGLFFFLLLIAAISWVTSYLTTLRANERITQLLSPPEETTTVFADEKDEKNESSISFEYYIVRLEDEALNVYTCADNSEEFLYGEEIITSNLTKRDIEILERGTVLYTTAQLTEFMEDFIS